MDNYDVVIERTVRDLFKSSPLHQIKKFKTNKEKEIVKKDEELRNLILEKYPLLIKSIHSLEGISASLNDLQIIRKNFLGNIDLMEQNLKNENVYKFNTNLFHGCLDGLDGFSDEDEDDIDIDIEGIQENISESLEECWKIVNYSSDKEFDNLLLHLIGVKRKLNQLNEYHSKNTPDISLNDSKFLFENYDFILIQFMENLIKNFLHIDASYEQRRSYSYLQNYFLNFFSIFFLINSNKKLELSEYHKIIRDKNIDNFYHEIFNFNDDLNDGLRSLKSDNNINNTNNFNNIKLIDSLSKSIELLIKLILVKLSKNFNSLCNISSKEADMHSILVSNLIEIYCNSYMIILFINKLKINSLNPLTSQEDELKSEFIYTNLSDGPSSDDEELEKNGLEQLFDLKNILMKIKTIFSLDSNNPDSENYNIFNVGKIFNRIDTKNINRKFIEFIKKEIAKNFKYFNDNNFSQSLISIWQSSYNNIVSNHNHNYDNDLIRKNFPQKNENEDGDEFLFFNLIFSEIYLLQLGNVICEDYKKISFEKFTHTENDLSLKASDILNLMKEIQTFEGNKTLKKHTINILQRQTLDYLINSEKIVLDNIKKNENLNQTSTYVTFLVIFFWNKFTKLILIEFNFKDCLDVLIKFVKIFYESIIKDVNAYLQDVRELLYLENFYDENSCNINNITKKYESEDLFFTDSLNVLSNYLKNNFIFDNLDLENEKQGSTGSTKIKEKILELIIQNYYLEIKNINSSAEGILNKNILIDFALLRKIYLEITSGNPGDKGDDEIIQKFIEINNIAKMPDENKYNKYHEIYSFFIKKDIQDIEYKSTNIKMLKKNYLLHYNGLKNNFNSADSASKEFLDFHPRLNVFMINKNEIKFPKPNPSKQPNYINSNPTSKLLELRIDENYLSKINNQNNQSIKQDGESISQFAQHAQQYLKPSVSSNSSNKENPSNFLNNQSNQTQQPNIKEYLGFFGGMLKENIKNMAKNYIDNDKLG